MTACSGGDRPSLLREGTVQLLARFLVLAAVAYAVLLAAVFAFQRRLLYFPVRQDPTSAAAAARRAGLEPWIAGSGLLGWRSPRATHPAAAVALVFHGNAGTALDRTYLRDVLAAQRRQIDVRLVEYPGYGPRPGQPSEPTLVGAALEAIDHARREGDRPILLIGESLGAAVASLAAAERPQVVHGVFLVTPLTSVRAVARRHYPFVPPFLVRDRLAADEAIQRHPGPVAVLLAGRDEVVFPDLGRALFDSFPGPKRLWIQPDAGHNDLSYDPRDPTWAEALAFLLQDGAPR